jgi:hypothetical protein
MDTTGLPQKTGVIFTDERGTTAGGAARNHRRKDLLFSRGNAACPYPSSGGRGLRIWRTAVLSALLFLALPTVFGQSSHEFSIVGGGGISALHYQFGQESGKAGAGGSAGFGYACALSRQWSLLTGVEAMLFRTNIRPFELSDSYPANDGEMDFEFRYTASNFREGQYALMAVVPLMLRLHAGREGRYYAALGGKVALPLVSRTEISIDRLETRGYYPEWEIEMDHPAFQGFGAFNDLSGSDALSLTTGFILSAEGGVRLPLNKGCLYVGLSFDYGLNNISGTSHHRAILYHTEHPENFSLHSVLSSSDESGSFTEKATLVAAGVKVRIAFGGGGGGGGSNRKPGRYNAGNRKPAWH